MFWQMQKRKSSTKQSNAMTKRIWTDKEAKKLTALYPVTSHPKLMKIFKRSSASIYGKAELLGLSKDPAYMAELKKVFVANLVEGGKKTRFGKTESWNKGTKGIMKANSGTFKKGRLPHNTRQHGEESFDKDNHILVKIGHNHWVKKHFLLWESVNGKVPKGMVLRFKNGNPHDIRIDNLQVITKAENMQKNVVHHYPAELKQTIKLVNKLKKTIKDVKK